jgi:cation transport ATPase
MTYRTGIRALQYLSIFVMWMFALAIVIFIPWLIAVAARWNDALNWTLAISLVMLPVYLTVAGTLTYVFIGLRRGAAEDESDRPS